MIQAIIFDYGGTIDTDSLHWSEVLWKGYKHASIPVSKEEFRTSYVVAERALAKHAPRHVGEGERDGERALLHARADETALEHFAHEPEHAREGRENRHDGGISKNASA